jgi:hypothetical protein
MIERIDESMDRHYNDVFNCIVCNGNAEGFVEVSLGWREEPKTRLYLCKVHYDRIYSDHKKQWYKLE